MDELALILLQEVGVLKPAQLITVNALLIFYYRKWVWSSWQIGSRWIGSRQIEWRPSKEQLSLYYRISHQSWYTFKDPWTKNKRKHMFMEPLDVYLRHKLDNEGLHLIDNNVRAVQDALRPTYMTKLKAYSSFLAYYSNFLPNLTWTLALLYPEPPPAGNGLRSMKLYLSYLKIRVKLRLFLYL